MRQGKLSLYLIFAILLFAGFSCKQKGYYKKLIAIVPANLNSDELHSAWLPNNHFEGPENIEGAPPGCVYYQKRLHFSEAMVDVIGCYQKSESSETGWVYTFESALFNNFKDAQVRSEVDLLVEDIKKNITDRIRPLKIEEKSQN